MDEWGELVASTRPSPDRIGAMRTTAGLVPAVLYAGYFLTLAITDRIVWPVELWAGSILLAAATGLLLSYLVAPWRPAPADRGRETSTAR